MFLKKAKYWNDLEVPAKLFFEVLETMDNKLLTIQGKPKNGRFRKSVGQYF